MSSKIDPLKNIKNIGIKLSDFEEIKDGTKKYTLIGTGNFGYVEKMKSKKDNKIYAIKKIDKNSPQFNRKDFDRETEIMFHLKQENIIKLYGYFEDKENLNKFKEIFNDKKNKDELNKLKDNIEVFCLVLEYAKNGSLRNFIKNKVKNRNKNSVPIEETEIIKIFKQLLSGLKHLHNKGVMHRDITPDNILLDEKNNVKISDFGISAIHRDSKTQNKKISEQLFSTKTIVGRISFASPQVQSGEEYDYSCDIYSLGLTMLYMMSYENPISVKKNAEGVKTRKLNVKNMHAKYDPYLQKLVLRMIKDDPKLRPTSSDAYDELEVIEIFKGSPNNKIIKKSLDKKNYPFDSESDKKNNEVNKNYQRLHTDADVRNKNGVKPDSKTKIISGKKTTIEEGFNCSNNIYSESEKIQNQSKTFQRSSINTSYFPPNPNNNNNSVIYNDYQTYQTYQPYQPYNTINYDHYNNPKENIAQRALRSTFMLSKFTQISRDIFEAINHIKK